MEVWSCHNIDMICQICPTFRVVRVCVSSNSSGRIIHLRSSTSNAHFSALASPCILPFSQVPTSANWIFCIFLRQTNLRDQRKNCHWKKSAGPVKQSVPYGLTFSISQLSFTSLFVRSLSLSGFLGLTLDKDQKASRKESSNSSEK